MSQQQEVSQSNRISAEEQSSRVNNLKADAYERLAMGARLVQLEEIESEDEELDALEALEAIDVDNQGRLVYATKAGVQKPVRKDQQKKNLGKLAERVAKEAEMAKAKVVRPRTYEPPSVEVEMEEAEASTAAAPKKRTPKEPVIKRTLRNDILDLPSVNDIIRNKVMNAEILFKLTLPEMALLSDPLRKYLFGRTVKDSEIAKEQQGGSSSQEVPAANNPNEPPVIVRSNRLAAQPLLSARSGTFEITIRGQQIRALFDSGSEINRIGWSDILRLGLPYSESVQWGMTCANGSREMLDIVATYVTVSIGDVDVVCHLFATKGKDCDFLLGRPFEIQAHAQFTNEFDGSYTCKIWSVDGTKEAKFQLAGPREHGGRTANTRSIKVDMGEVEGVLGKVLAQ